MEEKIMFFSQSGNDLTDVLATALPAYRDRFCAGLLLIP
jgi:hypothetical protein